MNQQLDNLVGLGTKEQGEGGERSSFFFEEDFPYIFLYASENTARMMSDALSSFS